MKPERALIAERILAQHCPELFRSGGEPLDLLPATARLGETLSRVLAASLAALSGGDAPVLRCLAPRECTMAELAADIAPLAANSMLAAGAHGVPVLASLQADAVLRLVDRAFGGRGVAPSPLPAAFPLSAELMVGRLEDMVMNALARALGQPDTVRALRRDGCIEQLAAFPAAERVAALVLEVEDPGHAAWTLTLAVPIAVLAQLVGDGGTSAAAPPRTHAPNPSDEPFGDIELTVSGALVDMRIGFATIAALQPGQILPVAVARSIPLKVGGKTIAHGAIGAVDDRVAVQITQIF